MKIGSLFSGIGGLELGLEMCGLGPVIWQAESDPYARAVLAKHWPEVKRYNDVREVDEQTERPDIICGGFPCQDISNAGKRAGIDGERSGLWSEFARIIRVLRPRYVFIENVAALVNRGLDRVLGDLAACGYDAEWSVLRAADVGAPHLRRRVFILAHAASERGGRMAARQEWDASPNAGRSGARHVADADKIGWRQGPDDVSKGEPESRRSRENVAHSCSARPKDVQGSQKGGELDRQRTSTDSGWWNIEPDVGRVAHGVPKRVDRIGCLGNAVVPQQAALAFQMLFQKEKSPTEAGLVP